MPHDNKARDRRRQGGTKPLAPRFQGNHLCTICGRGPTEPARIRRPNWRVAETVNLCELHLHDLTRIAPRQPSGEYLYGGQQQHQDEPADADETRPPSNNTYHLGYGVRSKGREWDSL